MEPRRKLDLWTFDFEWQALQWTSFLEHMMTSIAWQFSHRKKRIFFHLWWLFDCKKYIKKNRGKKSFFT
jgi:hypothetical protein